MRKLLFLILPAMLLLSADCEQDPVVPNAGLDIQFTSTYAGEPLVMFSETYAYPDNNEVQFQLFQYYLSNITLLREIDDTEGVLLSEVELIEYKDQITREASEQGVSLFYGAIPAGQYAAIRFGLGVAPALNATMPGDYSPGTPLSDHYWSAARGYVFAKIEGRADRTGDGDLETGLTYHVGADELYRTLTFPIDLNLDELELGQLSFEVDLQEVMLSATASIDIEEDDNTIDHTSNPEIYNALWNNLSVALKMRN